MGASTVLPTISASQAQKEVVANAWAVSLAPAALYGYKPATSTGLVFGYYGGTLPDAARTTIADGTVTLTDATTNYVEATSAGVVSANTSAFTAGRQPLYQIVCAAGAITTVTDLRTAVNFNAVVQLDTNIEDALTAHAGGTKAAALAMNAAYDKHRFSVCATNADSALLPAATVGRRDFVKNSGAANMAIYGAGTDQIDDAATATAYTLNAGIGRYFECLSAGKWYTAE